MTRNKNVFFLAIYLLVGTFGIALNAQTSNAPTLILETQSEMSEGEVKGYILQHMKGTSPKQVGRLTRLIRKLAKQYKVACGLILAVIRVESGFNTMAVSPKGALGLMQIMPDTGFWLSQKMGLRWQGASQLLLNPELNLRMGVYYLSYLRNMFEGDLKKALSAYNRGPAKVDQEIDRGRTLALDYYHKVNQHLAEMRFSFL